MYACKVMDRSKIQGRTLSNLKNEIALLADIKNKNVVGLKDMQKTLNNFYLIMDYCNGSDLEKLRAARGGRFTEVESRLILR
eukprot:CAMPEP_0176355724 /NCGR_PEP_ID=MMETSP0126-20121128/13498_1 /TAXON_ID=141414 ORGANISM="Strombidinopsis acuminatum, Strain SPMC142" /NCGR_SAMPLE_ID=MMETSP0126 /ASSEMBLY_ACC=CAM_ASM_000229 /LENGTH=81 /DNA_ID=CAMNT_0017708495 /DNA_START=193 /DNA_END=438 /DNA_ORIENTATION=+